MTARLKYTLAAGLLGGLVLQAILLLLMRDVPWPWSWSASLVITLALVFAFAANGWLDAAKGIVFAACIRAIFTFVLTYASGVLGGKIPYGSIR